MAALLGGAGYKWWLASSVATLSLLGFCGKEASWILYIAWEIEGCYRNNSWWTWWVNAWDCTTRLYCKFGRKTWINALLYTAMYTL